jgi:bacterioferritin-associated ferredoxin
MKKNLILCHCWDVTDHEIEEVISGGAPDIEWIKRHTGLATGGCQGRWCLELALSWLREHYPDYEWNSLPTARQPLYPVQAWRLAGATPEDDSK